MHATTRARVVPLGCARRSSEAPPSSDRLEVRYSDRVDLHLVWHGSLADGRRALTRLLRTRPRRPERPTVGGVYLPDVPLDRARRWIVEHSADVEIVSPLWLAEWLDDELARDAAGEATDLSRARSGGEG